MADEPLLKLGATGDAVTRLQQELQQAGFDPGGVDGAFGPLTDTAVKAFQLAKGLTVDGEVGPQTWAALNAAGGHQPGGDLRGQIVAHALWGVANEPQIHYQQIRPIDGIGHSHKLPLSTDCSGFATLCYNWAGAPDPNGLSYNGFGFTGTLLNHLQHIQPADARPGDLVVIGPGSGSHVVIIVTAGPDPEVVSHGGEAGPRRQHLSVDGRQPRRFLRSPSVAMAAEPAPMALAAEPVEIPDDLTNATNPHSE